MGPEQVHGASLISLDDQRGRKIYTLRTLYIFNSLALMSLALVAPKTARFTCGVRIFDLNFQRNPLIDSESIFRAKLRRG